METVDLRKIEGVVRKSNKDDIARRHRYVFYLTNGENELSIITIKIGEQKWDVKTKNPQQYLENIFSRLINGTPSVKVPIVKKILDSFARETLTLEEIKQIEIKVRKLSS